ncbi:hypothetical protein ASE07_26290 [Noviherbaspirillum sp. Root189]|nr:hypothetical protein ASE07_26290 [Noviherbaspirillum sp. Root189]
MVLNSSPIPAPPAANPLVPTMAIAPTPIAAPAAKPVNSQFMLGLWPIGSCRRAACVIDTAAK